MFRASVCDRHKWAVALGRPAARLCTCSVKLSCGQAAMACPTHAGLRLAVTISNSKTRVSCLIWIRDVAAWRQVLQPEACPAGPGCSACGWLAACRLLAPYPGHAQSTAHACCIHRIAAGLLPACFGRLARYKNIVTELSQGPCLTGIQRLNQRQDGWLTEHGHELRFLVRMSESGNLQQAL